MKRNITINMKDYVLDLITNGVDDYKNIVICFHGFNGDKWGDAYSGLKHRLSSSLLASFDSCGHGKSEVSSLDMRLDIILEEIDAVINFFKRVSDKPIILVAGSYGAYRVMLYLVKYKPEIRKVIYVNPAFNMLEILQKAKNFKYKEVKENDLVVMKRSLNKFMKKDFLDDLYNNNLYSNVYDINYDTDIVVGSRDTLIPVGDTIDIANRYNYNISYVDDEHCFENKENWQVIVKMIEGVV